MAKVKQPYPEERFVPWLGRNVRSGEVVDVPDRDLASYLEAGWAPGDAATKKAAADLAKPAVDQGQPAAAGEGA